MAASEIFGEESKIGPNAGTPARSRPCTSAVVAMPPT